MDLPLSAASGIPPCCDAELHRLLRDVESASREGPMVWASFLLECGHALVVLRRWREPYLLYASALTIADATTNAEVSLAGYLLSRSSD